jgi:hypothetical protein
LSKRHRDQDRDGEKPGGDVEGTRLDHDYGIVNHGENANRTAGAQRQWKFAPFTPILTEIGVISIILNTQKAV